MARGGGNDAGVGDGLELSLCLGTSTPAPRNNLTVVFDQRVPCAVDVVGMQAMAIISRASRETTMGKNTTDNGGITHHDHGCSKVAPAWRGRAHRAPSPASPEQGDIVVPIPVLIGDQAGLSMKRSLQRFLEKRKARANAASPYGVNRPARPPRS
uniref:Uncharacterized protein n=1 Tax=Avena sativa TaxID=4498 RepID=A0ACD5X8F4_AVESA